MYLLDTHFLIWALEGNKSKIGLEKYELIENPQTLIFVSIVNAWEIVIKTALGKLKVPDDFPDAVQQCGFKWLNIELSHIMTLGQLPALHNDPFDRLLVAQAKTENLTIITQDENIKKYPIKYFT